MAWYTRFTRFGDMHLCYGQEAQNSCGIASIMMCVFKINKLVPGKTAFRAEEDIYKVYGEVVGDTYDGSAYTRASKLSVVLNKLQCGTWKAEAVAKNDVSSKIVEIVGSRSALRAGLVLTVNPIIVLVKWDAGGGHFVVVDTVRTVLNYGFATVCDPWDANVHVTSITKGQPFEYVGSPVPYSWSVGSPPKAYKAPSSGDANGWVIYRTKTG